MSSQLNFETKPYLQMDLARGSSIFPTHTGSQLPCDFETTKFNTYCMSKKSCPTFIVYSLNKIGHDFFDIHFTIAVFLNNIFVLKM